jgi:hypothetical protein
LQTPVRSEADVTPQKPIVGRTNIMNPLMPKTVLLATCCAAVVLCAAPASSAPKSTTPKSSAAANSAPTDPTAVCESAYVAYGKAIEAEKVGHLRQARDDLMTCALSSCGDLVPKCRERHKQLGLEMASIVPIVTDETGATRVDVRVTIDGELLTSHLDGRGLPIEPGLHEFAFGMDGKVFNTQKIMIVEGQRNRVLSVTRDTKVSSAKVALAVPAKVAPAPNETVSEKPASDKAGTDKTAPDKPATDEPASEQTSPDQPAPAGPSKWALPHAPWPYVIGGAGVAAVAAGALLTFWGNKDNTELQNQCAPNCNPSSQDHIKAMYVASDVSFVAGLGALGVATWLFARSRSAEKAPTPSTAVLSVTPTPSGAFASVSGKF